MKDSFHRFGEVISELKLAAVMIFAALNSPGVAAVFPLGAYLFAFVALLLARTLALAVSLFGTHLSLREWVTIAWFGSKGFSSVLFGLNVLCSGVAHAEELFHLAALVIVTSMLLHSFTDVVVAGWVAEEKDASGDDDREAGKAA